MKRSAVIASLALASVAVLPAAGFAQPTSRTAARLPKPPVVLAKLAVQVTTSSNWTNVTFSQGQLVLSRQRDALGTWTVAGDQINLANGTPTGTKHVTATVLDLDTSGAPIKVTINKGQLGQARVAIKNQTTGQSFKPLVNAKHAASTSYAVSATYSKAQLIGTKPATLPRVDPRKLVLAFYYPWYHRSEYGQSAVAERPKDPRSTYSQAGVSSMTAQAKANGVDGFIQSWAGASADGKQFRLALNAADRQHQVISGYLESVMATQGHLLDGEQRELQWLVQLLKYRHNKAFLKTKGGTPVVFVYTMDALSPAQWSDLLGKLHSTYHLNVALVGDDLGSTYLPYEYGMHYYNPVASPTSMQQFVINIGLRLKGRAALFPSASKKLIALPVSPGYDPSQIRPHDTVVPRAGGKRYEQTWRAALLGQPDWILVTSWNEWFEDTAIEPGTRSGSRALAITREESAAWKARK